MEGQDDAKYLGPLVVVFTWFKEKLMKYE